MSSQDRAKWGDLERELVAAERLEREAYEAAVRAFGPEMAATLPGPKPPSSWRPPSMGGGEAPAPKEERPFLDTDGRLILE
jgi:hypothetical protein